MTTILKLPIKSLNEAVIRDIREKYPEAIVQFEAELVPDFEKMDDNRFWEIIGRLDWQQSDRSSILQPAVEELSQFPVESIKRFHELLAEKLYALDGRRFAVYLGSNRYDDDGKNYFSVDDFLYSRCGVIARGKAFYEMVLHNPARIPKEFTFESLLYMPRKAYQHKTGLEDYDYVTETWYETFSNPDGWPGIVPLKEKILAL